MVDARMRVFAAATLAACLAAAPAVAQEAPGGEGGRARMLDAFRELGAPPAVLAALEAEAADHGDTRASDRALREVVPEYAAAVEKALAGDPAAALGLAELAGQGGHPLVTAHARYYLGRVMLDADDPEGAVEVLGDFLAESRGLTTLDADAVFHFCYALALVPDMEEAILNFHAFLRLYPGAPERLVATARQILAELENHYQNPLHHIADDMKGVERRIRRVDTGDETRHRQRNIVARLDELIEELERMEQSGGGGAPSGNTPPAGPAGQGGLPVGPTRIGALHGMGRLQDRWGMMRDREREQILTDVQSRLPERYRELLEQYYRKLNRGAR